MQSFYVEVIKECLKDICDQKLSLNPLDTTILSRIHDSLTTISEGGNIFFQIFSSNSEAEASDLLENNEELSLRYYMR